MLQNIPNEPVLWALGGLFAAAALAEMMRRRQMHLQSLLQKVVEKKLEWAKKKAKAAYMAKLAAERKAAEEAAFRRQLAASEEIGELDPEEKENAFGDPTAPVLFD